jgi:hypothetical protein
MMRSILVASVAVLATAAVVSAQGTAVTVAVLDKADREREQITIRSQVTEMVPVTKEIVVVINGKNETRTITEYASIMREMEVNITLTAHDAFTADGKRLDKQALWQRLQPKTVVVLGSETLLQPHVRQVFRENVILLVARPVVPEKK